MRERRFTAKGVGSYHCMSRTVNGEALFGRREKEVLRKMLHQVADFSGVQVLTFCLMDNHFHLLVRIDPDAVVTDEELIRRYRVLYPKPTKYQVISMEAMALELRNDGADAAAIRTRLLARMGNVSAFMKTLKQRFSTWYNRSHDRFGPLWSDRFKSVLVEGAGAALQTVAAYIDLNPVRAGLVEDPKDYRFCAYAEAVAGHREAATGLTFAIAGSYAVKANLALADYRTLLFGKGAAVAAGAATIDHKQALRVLQQQGRLPVATLLRCRVRYFSEGLVLGSKAFVESYLQQSVQGTQRKRRPKPQPVPCEEGAPFVALRGVRGSAYS